MKRKIMPIVLILIAVICATASADMSRVSSAYPELHFNGNTAYCSIEVSDSNSEISATLELWRGNRRLVSWSDSDTSYLYISGTYAVESGTSYTLKVSGTIDGVSFVGTPITKTCP